jgi:hypothetical protein
MHYKAEVTDNVQAIEDAGFRLRRVDYENGFGTEEGVDMVTTTTVDAAVDAILAVDQSWLYVSTGGTDLGDTTRQELWIFFVLGNESGVVVNDWLIPSDQELADLLDHTLTLVSDKWQDVAEVRRLVT